MEGQLLTSIAIKTKPNFNHKCIESSWTECIYMYSYRVVDRQTPQTKPNQHGVNAPVNI